MGEAELPGRKRQPEAQGWKDVDAHLLHSTSAPVPPLLKAFPRAHRIPREGSLLLPPSPKPPQRDTAPAEQQPVPFFCWAGVGERELAEDTGLARSAYMSSESALRTELLLDEALDTEETLLTLRDLPRATAQHTQEGSKAFLHLPARWEARQGMMHKGCVSCGAAGVKNLKAVGCRPRK